MESLREMTLALEPGVLEEAQLLAAVLRGDDDDPGADDLMARNSLGWLYWYRWRARPDGPEGQEDLEVAIDMLLPCFLVSDSGLPGSLLPVLAHQAAPAALAALRQLLDSADPDLLEETLRLWQARLPSPVLLTEPDPAGQAPAEPGELPTRDNVLARLPGAAIAHFACHGFSDSADPSQSLLQLHDHRDSPLNVAALAAVSLDHAQLAYLSACTTARPGGAGLLDEAIHLSLALQLAGFPQGSSKAPVKAKRNLSDGRRFWLLLLLLLRALGWL